MDAPYGKLEELEAGVARVLAHNPSAFTYYGTQTYLAGTGEVVVIDPGPDIPEHLEAVEQAIGGRRVVAIMCTHTHRDHSPGARPLVQRTGAPIVGCAPLALETVGPRADASFDGDYAADRVLADGESVLVDGEPITAVATPGHTSNHLCFAYRGALFSGDHVMGWSTTVVV
ncbi:MAG TPA: MBL fold metallo-hydrolase, partial [Sphingomicrobium sp.]